MNTAEVAEDPNIPKINNLLTNTAHVGLTETRNRGKCLPSGIRMNATLSGDLPHSELASSL